MRTLLLILLLFSTTANAAWYEAAGRAVRIADEPEIARNLAIQDALRQAMLYAGANVSSLQELSQGLLHQDKLKVQSHGSVKDIQLIDEHQDSDYQYVTIRVNIIVKESSQCIDSKTVKSVAITHFPLRHRHQATTGAIYELSQHTASRLYKKLNKPQRPLVASQLLENTGQWQTSVQPLTGHTTLNPQQWMAAQTNGQYILTGEIGDLSIDKPKSGWFGLVNEAPMRNFTLHLSLYQRHSGELIWQQDYQTRARWTYPIREHVDVSGAEFWNSSFGRAIDNISHTALNDLSDKLACEPSTGEIIAVENDSLTINLGSVHGMQKGGLLKVLHQSPFTDPQGRVRQKITISDSKLVIEDVQRYHLVAKPMGHTLDSAIQIRDLVVKE